MLCVPYAMWRMLYILYTLLCAITTLCVILKLYDVGTPMLLALCTLVIANSVTLLALCIVSCTLCSVRSPLCA
jgi:hypothetical protein